MRSSPLPPAIPAPRWRGRVGRELFAGDVVQQLELSDPRITHVPLVHVELDPLPGMLVRACATAVGCHRARPVGLGVRVVVLLSDAGRCGWLAAV
jgi:hypothetical protein